MKRLFSLLIRGYRRRISPLIPARCRYEPSCSAFAEEAVRRHGALRGGILAGWRLLRCNPFSHGGFDPVPEKFDLRRGPVDPAVWHGEKEKAA